MHRMLSPIEKHLTFDYTNLGGLTNESEYKLLKRVNADSVWVDTTGIAMVNTLNKIFILNNVLEYDEYAIGESEKQQPAAHLLLQNDSVAINDSMYYEGYSTITAAGETTYFIIDADGASGGKCTFSDGYLIDVKP